MEIVTYSKPVCEGVDIDAVKRLVGYNSEHEENVDTSTGTNPTVTSAGFDKSIQIWSVFKRKDNYYRDGNPLIYAMKDEKGWKFRSEEDKNKIYEAINIILMKYFSSHSSDVTIMVPSMGALNQIFLEMTKKYNENAMVITDIISKMTTEEVLDDAWEPDSKFRKEFGKNQYDFEEAYEKLENFCKNKNMGYYFRSHLIPDIKIRNAVEKTMKINDKRVGKYLEAINDKNLLIIDDTITLGKTIKNVCDEVKKYFKPKSITVLTLFSKRYDQK